MAYRPLIMAALVAVIAAIVPSSARAPTAQGVVGGSSFYEAFDTIDQRRWMASDGWSNGSHQGCTWAARNLAAAGGALTMTLDDRKSPQRAFTCAELQSRQRYGYGLYEVRMRSAAGAGMNTAMFTYSGPPLTPRHDEIDFEFLGRAVNQVQTNYYVVGAPQGGTNAPLGADGSAGFITYAFDWRPGLVRWYVNGKLVRSAQTASMPIEPGKLYLSLWNGQGANMEQWLGRFAYPGRPIIAVVDWVAYTKAGERCRFSASLSCATGYR